MAETYYGTGRRKNAIAKVWLREGTGQVVVNGRSMPDYLMRATLEVQAISPLTVSNLTDRFDVNVKCLGGGNSGQAGAIRHGIARALVQYDESLRKLMRTYGMLTRDARVKERKKYGRKRARRGFQFSKR
ncbi:MAG TPA: 30S ribosomal protein S9 [Armatimonadota bacterium]